MGESIGSFYAVQTKGVNPANGQRIFVQLIKDANGVVTGTRDVQYNHACNYQRWTLLDGTAAPRGADQASDGQIIGPALPK